jgi:hypothetical protein
VVFAKAASKTLNLTRISYILASPAAMEVKYEPVQELTSKRSKRRPVTLHVTPSIVSSDGKTYVRILKNSVKKQPILQHVKSPYSSTQQPQPQQPAQVVVNTVSAFYNQDDASKFVSPASHNAVIQTLSPSMRRSLGARRIRGGAGSNALLKRLEIGAYFGAWYALNVIYNSKFCLL